MLIRGILFAGLAATTVWLCKISPEIKAGAEPGVIMQLPEHAGHFTGQKQEPDPVEVEVLPKDTEFARTLYYTTDADTGQHDLATVSIVLSGAQRRSIHRPEVCLQSQGWTILDSRVLPVTMTDGRNLRVRDLYMSKSVTLAGNSTPRPIRAHFIYWFVGTNVSTPDHVERTWITLRDNVFSGVNHRWAYSYATALVTEGFSPQEIGQRIRTNEETRALLVELIQDVAPKFQKEYLPTPIALHHS